MRQIQILASRIFPVHGGKRKTSINITRKCLAFGSVNGCVTSYVAGRGEESSSDLECI